MRLCATHSTLKQRALNTIDVITATVRRLGQPLALALFAATLLPVSSATAQLAAPETDTPAATAPSTPAPPARAPITNGPRSVAPIAEKLIDAVVNISSTQVAPNSDGVPLPNVPDGSPFEDFFEDFFNRRGGRNRPSQRKVSSLGSGFVIDGKEGLVVTNNHVIDGADEIVVNFSDGSKLKVDKILGRDPKTDLALLKVTPRTPLVDVKFGSSQNLRVGDWVMAIGNPFGLGGSLTVGIISAKQRDINAGPYDDFLQTDASINKGNSGGPLFDMDGNVIGVNTAIISPTGGSIGIGFAVPSDTVTAVINQLREFGRVRRGWLGVKIQSINEDIAESLGLPQNTGALVSAITPNSPAARGNLRPGDVIMKFDGKVVSTMRGLPKIVAQTQIGKDVEVEVLRQGQKETLSVAVGLLEEDPIEATPASKPEPKKERETTSLLGLTLLPLTDEARKRFELRPDMSGLLVMDIDRNSFAASKNIKIGDVIVEAHQQPANSIDDLKAAIQKIKKSGGKTVLLLLEDKKGDTRFVAVPYQ